MLQSKIQRKLSMMVKRLGGRLFKWQSPGNDGVPDVIVIMPMGRIYFVELKTDTGKLRALQEWQIESLRSLGCQCRVLHGQADVKVFVEELSAGSLEVDTKQELKQLNQLISKMVEADNAV